MVSLEKQSRSENTVRATMIPEKICVTLFFNLQCIFPIPNSFIATTDTLMVYFLPFVNIRFLLSHESATVTDFCSTIFAESFYLGKRLNWASTPKLTFAPGFASARFAVICGRLQWEFLPIHRVRIHQTMLLIRQNLQRAIVI